jgi:hypothetical protein
MSEAPSTDQLLPEYEDVVYSEPPKTIALYLDATKWIVGLATGSFFLMGSVLASRPDAGASLWVAGAAILSMALAAGLGVRALQCYTRLNNLFEIHAAKKVFEVSVRNDSYKDVRWVTKERKLRCGEISAWLNRSNFAYTGMTWLFGIGLALYLVYAGLYLMVKKSPSDPNFVLSSAPQSAVLGVLHDPASRSDCIVVRSAAGVTCAPVSVEAGK